MQTTINNGKIDINVVASVCPHYKTKTPTYLIAFYDNRTQSTEFGQKISEYFAETLMNSDLGINLAMSDSPDWFTTHENTKAVQEWIKNLPTPQLA